MAYISSDKIFVFPSTRRSKEQQTSRLFTEATIVSFINKLIDKDGFVIPQDASNPTAVNVNVPFEFNIHGYYFKVSKASDITGALSTASSIYANIEIDDTITNYEELSGQDNNSNYEGVEFSANDPTLGATYYLEILKKDGSDWLVPTESLVKFNKQSTSHNTLIDCGEI